MTAPPAAAIEVRRLTYADLPQVVAIERRAFPTPWSLAMFVLELSKPGGVCLAARRDGGLVGSLICSRYDTVWHVMNVAVAPERLGWGWASFAFGAWKKLSAVDRTLNRVLPQGIFYNVGITGVRPGPAGG